MREEEYSPWWSLFGIGGVFFYLFALIEGIWFFNPVFKQMGATSSPWFWAFMVVYSPGFAYFGVVAGELYRSILRPSGSSDSAES